MNAIVEKIRVPTDVENMGRLNPFHWGRGGGGGGGSSKFDVRLSQYMGKAWGA